MSGPATGHSMTVVNRARELVAAGWSAEGASRVLAQEGISVTARTIRRWCDPQLAKRDRERSLEQHRRRSGRHARFVLSGSTPQYRAAFIRQLAGEGMLHTQIAIACRVVLEIDITRGDVDAVVAGRLPRKLKAARA